MLLSIMSLFIMPLFIPIKRIIVHLLLLTLFLLQLSACSQTGVVADMDNNNFVLVNVNIVDVATGDVHPEHQVLVIDGKIAEISKYLAKPSDLRVIDAKGGFLLPGLIDMHVHAYDKSAFELSLSHGVTHVRIMNGIPAHIGWRQQQRQGDWLASSLTVSSPIVHSNIEPPLSWTANNAEEARRLVHRADEVGYDLIKAYGSMNKEALSAMIDEAKLINIPIAKHGPHPPKGMKWKKLANFQSLEHAEDIYQGMLSHKHDELALPEAVNKIANLNVPVTPTLNIFWQLTKISEEKETYVDSIPEGYISPVIAFDEKRNQVARWLTSSEEMVAHNKKTFSFLQKISKRLADADIPLLVGSDAGVLLSPHGIATVNEMNLLHASGISNLNVIRAATINAAKALKLEDQIGEIKAGLQADFILLKRNPIEYIDTIAHPLAVSKNGVWLEQQDLLVLRDQAIADQNWLVELWTLIVNY